MTWNFQDSRQDWDCKGYVDSDSVMAQIHQLKDHYDENDVVYVAVENVIEEALFDKGMGKIVEFMRDSKDWELMIAKIAHDLPTEH